MSASGPAPAVATLWPVRELPQRPAGTPLFADLRDIQSAEYSLTFGHLSIGVAEATAARVEVRWHLRVDLAAPAHHGPPPPLRTQQDKEPRLRWSCAVCETLDQLLPRMQLDHQGAREVTSRRQWDNLESLRGVDVFEPGPGWSARGSLQVRFDDRQIEVPIREVSGGRI